jgi:hypothetical protein
MSGTIFHLPDRGDWVLETSPTNSVRYEAQSKSYGNYSHTEMRKLVEHFVTLELEEMGVLALSYTGAMM